MKAPLTEDTLRSLDSALEIGDPSISREDVQRLIDEVRALRQSADIVRSLVREAADAIDDEITATLGWEAK